MANGAVRELVTKVTFRLDEQSVNKINRTINELKRNLSRFGDGMEAPMMTSFRNIRRSITQTTDAVRELRRQMNGLNGSNIQNNGGRIGGNNNGGIRDTINAGNLRVQAGRVFVHGFNPSAQHINSQITGSQQGLLNAIRNIRVTHADHVYVKGNINGNGSENNSRGGGNHGGGNNGSGNNNGGSLNSRVRNFADNSSTLMAAGGAMLAPLAWATKTAANFEEASSNVQALTTFGKSAEEARRIKETLEKKALEMGESTRFSATESMNAMEKMAMAGWNDKQITAGINPMLNLAIAGSADIVTTSDIVTDAMTALHMGADETERFTDALAVASAKSNTNVKMMGETFKYAAAPAGALGYTIEDLALATGLMANAGIKDSQAGTALRSTFTRLSTEPQDAAKAMNILGISLTEIGEDGQEHIKPLRKTIDELRGAFKSVDPERLIQMEEALTGSKVKDKEKMLDMLKKMQANGGKLNDKDKVRFSAMLAGQEAMSGFMAMALADDNTYNDLVDAMQHTEGMASQMAAIKAANTKGDLTNLNSAIEGFGISIGNLLLPPVAELLQIITPVVRSMSEWVKENPKLAATIIGVVAAVGGLLALLGTLGFFVGGIMSLGTAFGALSAFIAPAIGAIGTAFSVIGGIIASAFGAISAPILAVIALIALLIIYWDEVGAVASSAINWIINNLTWLGNSIMEVINAATASFNEWWESVKIGATITAVSIATAFFQKIEEVKTFFLSLRDHALNILREIANAITEWIGGKLEWAQNSLSGLKNFASGVLDGIGNSIATAYNSVTNTQTNTYNLSSANQLGAAASSANIFYRGG